MLLFLILNLQTELAGRYSQVPAVSGKYCSNSIMLRPVLNTAMQDVPRRMLSRDPRKRMFVIMNFIKSNIFSDIIKNIDSILKIIIIMYFIFLF